MTRPLAAAGLVAALVACGRPAPVPFATEGEADLFAVIELDAQGNLRAATPIRPLGDSAAVFTRGDAIALGWRSADLAALGGPPLEALANAPLEAATGCETALPPPAVTRRLGGPEGEGVALPALTTPWLDTACPAVDEADFAFDVTCQKFRCPLTVTRRTACTFDFDLDCEVGRIAGTLRPDGTLCLEPPAALACAPEAAPPPRAAALSCEAPEPCRIEAYVAADPGLEVDAVRLLDVPPFSPVPDLIGQLVLPPTASRFFGYAHDLAVRGDRVAVSLGSGSAFTECPFQRLGTTALQVFDADTLTRTATATHAGCLMRLAAGPGGFYALRDLLNRYELVRLSDDGEILAAAPADPRPSVGPDDPPRLFSLNARPTYLGVIGDRLVAVVVSGLPPGTKIFTWDADSLEPRTRTWLPDATVVAAAPGEAGAVVLGFTARSGYGTFDAATGRVRGPVPLPADLIRDDNITSEVAWSPVDARALLLLSRKNASLLSMDSTGVRTRAVIFDRDARPMAARRFPDRDLALVIGTFSTDEIAWPASLHLYDLEAHRFRAGAVDVGHGAPGRLVPDERGRLWALMPWDARLLRVRLP